MTGVSASADESEKRRDERIVARFFNFKMERRIRAAGGRAALGMTPAHHGGVEPLLQDFSAARFEHGFAAKYRRAMRLVVEVGLQPVRLFG